MLKQLAAFAALICMSPPQAGAQGAFNLRIGTFAIDLYHLNAAADGSVGMSNFSYMTGLAQNFYFGALPYQPMTPPAGHSSVSITHAQKFENTQVTRSALTDLVVGSGTHREENDFLLYGGHGDHGSLFLGMGPAYGYILPGDLQLGAANADGKPAVPGAGSVRWFWSNSCLAFDHPGSPITYWSPAFRGLKAMLGYGSIAFDYPNSLATFNEFWVRWTHGGYSLFLAFLESQKKYESITHKGINLACLSAPPAPGRHDYCREGFQEINKSPAANNVAVQHTFTVGVPVYE